MKHRIHIFGASGSGTTTIAKMVCEKLGHTHLDTDDFFWEPTNPPYTTIRPREERQSLILNEIENKNRWILSGSLCGWGDIFIPYFDLAVFVYVPPIVRMERLKKREFERYGKKVFVGGEFYEKTKEFLNWTASYDESTGTGRSLQNHKRWMKQLSCQVLEIENLTDLDKNISNIVKVIME